MKTLKIAYLWKKHDIMSCFEVSYLSITLRSSYWHVCLGCLAVVLCDDVAGI